MSDQKAIKSALISVISQYQPISPDNAVLEAQKTHNMRFTHGREAILSLLDKKIIELTNTRQLTINSENQMKTDIVKTNNCKLIFSDPIYEIDDETGNIGRAINVKLSIYSDGQHDGRPWGENSVSFADRELKEHIIRELDKKVDQLIKEIKPFSVHK